ncbi:hypothetical protein NQ318_014209, partial [Aromia moschata]
VEPQRRTTKMSSSLSSRIKHPKKHELVKSHSQAQILATKLRQDGVMSTVEDVLQAVDQVAALLTSNAVDSNISYKDSVINLCQHLKRSRNGIGVLRVDASPSALPGLLSGVYGAYLEILYKEQLDHAFKIFRDKAQDDIRVDMLSRLHLLELIELRAKGWKGTDGMNLYYRKKLNQCGNFQIDMSDSVSSLTESINSMIMSSSPPLLAPGEVLKPSGKFNKPTRIPGKKYCKDEIVIRNADSGKVMGIKGRRVHMIEELSETVISFQRVNPGAKERLVQITGATEESINYAKQLIEDTIRRNASPVRENAVGVGSGQLTGSSSSINSSASDDSALPCSSRTSRILMHSLSTNDANIGEYKYTVITNGCTIKITGDNLDLVRVRVDLRDSDACKGAPQILALKTSKLVLDEYFSGEPIHDVSQFYSYDSLPQPIVADELPAAPPSPPNLCRPRTISLTGKTKKQFLAHLAMSPLCLAQPVEWERISQDYSGLIRNVVERFDAKQYLSDRIGKDTSVVSADDDDLTEV